MRERFGGQTVSIGFGMIWYIKKVKEEVLAEGEG